MAHPEGSALSSVRDPALKNEVKRELGVVSDAFHLSTPDAETGGSL